MPLLAGARGWGLRRAARERERRHVLMSFIIVRNYVEEKENAGGASFGRMYMYGIIMLMRGATRRQHTRMAVREFNNACV